MIAKDASYGLIFGADEAHFDDALAFAERTSQTIHAQPAGPIARPTESAEWKRGTRWG